MDQLFLVKEKKDKLLAQCSMYKSPDLIKKKPINEEKVYFTDAVGLKRRVHQFLTFVGRRHDSGAVRQQWHRWPRDCVKVIRGDRGGKFKGDF